MTPRMAQSTELPNGSSGGTVGCPLDGSYPVVTRKARS